MADGFMTLDALKTSLSDRYRIERELGAGGMATVYLAMTAFLGYALAKSGDRSGALATLDLLKSSTPHGPVAPFNQATVYLGLGKRRRAVDLLEQACEVNSEFLFWLGQDPLFEPLRSQPPFMARLKPLNFN
ncbi:MAG: hypothetical protein ABI765_05665 [Gemmatimonadota bacterium]